MVMLLEQSNSSPSNDVHVSSHKASRNAMNVVAPDSPTFRVFEDDDKITENNSLSDLALTVSSLYVNSLACATENADGVDACEEDTSLVLARNNLSASSFSNWELDPEDGSFHNSNQRLLLHNDSVETCEPEKRRVHFMADPSDTKLIYCEKFECPIVLTVDDIAAGWYTAPEIKRFRRHIHKEAYNVRNLPSSVYMDKFLDLHQSCARSIPITQSRAQAKLAAFVCSSQHRGQESLVFFELFRHERVRLSKELLLAQSTCRATYSVDDLSALLASVSKAMSRRSRRFAYMAGVGDAEVALEQVRSKEMKFIKSVTGKRLTEIPIDETFSTEHSSSEEDLGYVEI